MTGLANRPGKMEEPMKPDGKCVLVVSMDVAAEREELFNEVYDTEHVPALLEVPGVVSVRRYRRQPLKLSLGGSIREMIFENEPTYTAVYEVDSADVLIGEAWAKAVELGRWSAEVRPFTRNRRHTLHVPLTSRRR